jgi:hypothetical protein
MGQQVVMGAMMKCSFGASPMALIVIRPTVLEGSPVGQAANIMDKVPIKNIPPFVMCSSVANPTVIAATAAALGVLTPMPCVPIIPAPWVPGSPTVLVDGFPALNNSSKCMCTWAGVITITSAGQTTVQIP